MTVLGVPTEVRSRFLYFQLVLLAHSPAQHCQYAAAGPYISRLEGSSPLLCTSTPLSSSSPPLPFSRASLLASGSITSAWVTQDQFNSSGSQVLLSSSSPSSTPSAEARVVIGFLPSSFHHLQRPEAIAEYLSSSSLIWLSASGRRPYGNGLR
jgi:hypothetical protein